MNARNARTATRVRLPFWRRLGWRLGASFLLLTALGIFLSGYLQYRDQKHWVRTALTELLENIARTGALLVDASLHTSVQASPTMDSDAYRRLRATLAAIQKANQIVTPIYTLTDFNEDRREARFMVTSGGSAAPGEPYPLVTDLLDPLGRAFREGVSTHTGIYENQHGTWITAFAPIKNAKDEVFAVLDVDYSVEVYLKKLRAVRLRFLFYTLVGAVLALMAAVILTRQITRPVAQLSAMARRVVEGDLTLQNRIGSRDEIGLLGNVLHLMVERVHVSHRNTVDVLVRVLQVQSAESGSLLQLAGAALALADGLELSPTQREALELGALLHDIGAIRIPEAVLKKAGPLTPEERTIVEQHPAWGVEILETVPVLTPALDVVGGHHERYDGGGYPQGLRGEEIPLIARIFSAVDALDAITHDRPHRRARPLVEALEELRRMSGKQFDPRIVDAVLNISVERWQKLLVSVDNCHRKESP